MICIGMQMIDGRISSNWWKELLRCFVKEKQTLQLRCWNEEIEEIKQAQKYGISHVEGYETCVDGIVDTDFLHELLHTPEPTDKSLYNKMTKYFTIRVSDGKCIWESAHYGTEMYLVIPSEDLPLFQTIMEPYMDNFSLSIQDT